MEHSRKRFKPRDYQRILIEHLLERPRCAGWASMGLGKTVSTLSAIEANYLAGDTHPTLVLAPLRVAQSTWPDEAAKWEHLRNIEVQPIVGDVEARLKALRNTNASVFTTNYEQIPWLVEQFGNRWPFKRIVSDEATRLRGFRLNKGAKRATALGKVAWRFATEFKELTGTPAPNGLIDLWPQMWFLDRMRLGATYTAFKDRWFYPDPSGYGVKPVSHAGAEIQERIKDFCLTLKAEDWLPLEEPVVNVIKVKLPGKVMSEYKSLERKYFALFQDGVMIEAENAAIKSMKCMQVASGLLIPETGARAIEVHDAKIQALESIIEEANGMPVLVAYYFKDDLPRLLKAFPKGRHLDKDPQTIRDWNAGQIPIMFAHPQSAGHGLNLQDGGNILVFYTTNWNLEEHDQILERIGPVRQLQAGHNRLVYVIYLVAHDTIDEVILERIETKASVQEVLMNAMRRMK